MLLARVKPIRGPQDDVIDRACEEMMDLVDEMKARKANWVTRRSGPPHKEMACPREP